MHVYIAKEHFFCRTTEPSQAVLSLSFLSFPFFSCPFFPAALVRLLPASTRVSLPRASTRRSFWWISYPCRTGVCSRVMTSTCCWPLRWLLSWTCTVRMGPTANGVQLGPALRKELHVAQTCVHAWSGRKAQVSQSVTYVGAEHRTTDLCGQHRCVLTSVTEDEELLEQSRTLSTKGLELHELEVCPTQKPCRHDTLRRGTDC